MLARIRKAVSDAATAVLAGLLVVGVLLKGWTTGQTPKGPRRG